MFVVLQFRQSLRYQKQLHCHSYSGGIDLSIDKCMCRIRGKGVTLAKLHDYLHSRRVRNRIPKDEGVDRERGTGDVQGGGVTSE